MALVWLPPHIIPSWDSSLECSSQHATLGHPEGPTNQRPLGCDDVEVKHLFSTQTQPQTHAHTNTTTNTCTQTNTCAHTHTHTHSFPSLFTSLSVLLSPPFV